MGILTRSIKGITAIIVSLLISFIVFGDRINVINDLDLSWYMTFYLIGIIILLAINLFCKEGTWAQFAAVSIMPFLLSLVAFLVRKNDVSKGNMFVIVALVLSLSSFVIFLHIADWIIRFSFKNKIKWLGKNYPIIIAMALVVLTRIPYVDMMQRWDSGEYYGRFYKAVAGYTFNGVNEFFTAFSLCKHNTVAFSFMYMPGELLFPGQIIGVSITSIAMLTVAVWCMYKIFLKIINGVSTGRAAIYAFLMTMVPLFFATSTYFCPDYAMTLFAIFVIYGFVYNRPLIVAVFSYVCFQTKETGIVIIGGLAIGVILQHIFSNKPLTAFKKIFTDLRLYLTLAVTVMHGVICMMRGGFSGWSLEDEPVAAKPLWDNNGSECLGFNWPFMSTKIKEELFLNFNWIAMLIILVGILLMIIFHKRYRKNSSHTFEGMGIIGAWMAIVTFSCLFITASTVRYNIVDHVLFFMVMFYVYGNVVQNIFDAGSVFRRFRLDVVLAALYGGLLVGEAFLTIDPVTKALFVKCDAITADIYYVGQKKSTAGMYFGEYMIYNSQYQFIDRAYEQILKEIDYDPEKMDIILPDDDGVQMNGNPAAYALYWDSKLKKRVFYSEGTVRMPYFYCNADFSRSGIVDYPKLNDKAYYVVNPYILDINEERSVKHISRWYTIGDRHVVESPQGSIVYYDMTVKDTTREGY